VEKLRSNPLARALRVDKLTLAALQATLEIHRAGRAFEEIPVLNQLAKPADDIRKRAEQLVERLRSPSSVGNMVSVQQVSSASGGGALPEQSLPSWAIVIAGENAGDVSKRLRIGEPAVLGRIQDGRMLIDLRTVQPADEEMLISRLREFVDRKC
jgi:L-seryl-tRNA(Ser) seleniumtransferase